MTHAPKLLTSVLALSAVILILSPTVLAQSLPVQPCPSDALDVTFQAADGSDHGYTLGINLRNISDEPCSMDAHPGASGIPYKAADGSTVKVCWYRYYCEEGAEQPTAGRITLAPGESVHQTRSWRTTPTDGAAQCVSPPEMRWDDKGNNLAFGDYWLSSRSLLKPICSSMVITNYVSGQFLSETAAGVLTGSRLPLIHWATHDIPKSLEHIPLSVTIEDPARVLSLDEHSCPRLFVGVRDATPSRVVVSRSTRVVEVQTASCKVEAGGDSGRQYILDFEAASAFQQANENKGEYTVHVSSLVESRGRYFLVSATNPLQLSMVNGRFIRRIWSPPIKGVAVSLTLDNDVYAVGDDIPLHIAVENVDSHAAIAGMDPYMDPPGVAVELKASDGQPIPAPRMTTVWTGHGFCHRFLRGVVFPIELKLSQMNFRPDRPGVYTVTATWSPSEESCGDLYVSADHATTSHVTAKSSVTFRLVAASATAPSEPKH